jgi:hypothetical protein
MSLEIVRVIRASLGVRGARWYQIGNLGGGGLVGGGRNK